MRELLTIPNILRYARSAGIPIFENKDKNYNLNIWAIRSDTQKAGKFDDLQVIFWKAPTGRWEKVIFTCTTDPSDHYLLNPINPKGTAIIKPGHYSGLWKYGYHRDNDNHPALVQIGNKITVIRDFNKNAILDFHIPDNLNLYIKDVIRNNNGGYTIRYRDVADQIVYKEDIGYFGINNHRAHLSMIKKAVGLYSAGCIVQNDPHRYYNEFLPIIRNAKDNWGDSFSLTLITECSFNGFIYNKSKPKKLEYIQPVLTVPNKSINLDTKW